MRHSLLPPKEIPTHLQEKHLRGSFEVLMPPIAPILLPITSLHASSIGQLTPLEYQIYFNRQLAASANPVIIIDPRTQMHPTLSSFEEGWRC